MNQTKDNELTQYVAEQVMDYIEQNIEPGQALAKIEILSKGVTRICGAAYPEEKAAISHHASKLVRTALNTHHLSLSEKARKIFDPVSPPESKIIAEILDNILMLKEGIHYQKEVKMDALTNRNNNQKTRSQAPCQVQ